MFNYQKVAEEIVSIVRGLEKEDPLNNEIMLYKQGEIKLETVVKMILNYYYDYKVEELKKNLYNDKLIQLIVKLIKEKEKNK